MIRLVAWRELNERIRTRAFLVTLALLSLATVAVVLLNAYAGDRDTNRTVEVGVLGPTPTGALETALDALGAQVSTEFDVRSYRDLPALEQAVRDGDVDAGIDGATVIWHREVSTTDAPLIAAAVQAATIRDRAAALELPIDRVEELLRGTSIDDRVLDPRSRDHNVRIATAGAGVVVLFIALQLTGSLLMTGLVVEKSTRVVEVLLNHVRARQLLAGKVIGIGIAGTLQLGVTAIAALVALALTRGVDVPRVPAGAVVWFVVWFVAGYAIHASLFAIAASLISRQEDAGAVTFPAITPLIASYIMSIGLLAEPDGTLARVLSLVPLSAPLAMPVRIAAGSPPARDIALSLAFAAVTVVVLNRAAGRIYTATLLRTGNRVSWREALRAMRRAPADTLAG